MAHTVPFSPLTNVNHAWEAAGECARNADGAWRDADMAYTNAFSAWKYDQNSHGGTAPKPATLLALDDTSADASDHADTADEDLITLTRILTLILTLTLTLALILTLSLTIVLILLP